MACVVKKLVDLCRKPAHSCIDNALAHRRVLKDMCGTEECMHFVCPDCAADIQLAARLCAEKDCPHLHWVFRCGAHAAHGAVEAAWGTDEKVAEVDTLICEVAKFARSSPRFSDRVRELADLDVESDFAPIKNWSFAPHRFSSKAHLYARFVLFVRAALAALGEEAERPTTPKRAKWAGVLLGSVTVELLVLSGALADLAEDALAFVREFDAVINDSATVARAAPRFREYLDEVYVKGALWTKKGTYTPNV